MGFLHVLCRPWSVVFFNQPHNFLVDLNGIATPSPYPTPHTPHPHFKLLKGIHITRRAPFHSVKFIVIMSHKQVINQGLSPLVAMPACDWPIKGCKQTKSSPRTGPTGRASSCRRARPGPRPLRPAPRASPLPLPQAASQQRSLTNLPRPHLDGRLWPGS